EIAELEARAQSLCARLSEQRQQGAKQFSESVQSHLRDLAMAQAQFLVSVQPKPIDSTGADSVEFLFSANPGEPPRPLTKIASGGEMSRVMLALKTVLAHASPVPTLVFDEIDAGLGGRTAQSVAEKLSQLARQFQVLCVTHLPQIASRGDYHLQIDKQVAGDTTRVLVTPLSEEERVKEIARMLAGEPSETALQHARELLATNR
ncbi:MAG: DNA repair protein RecN, partial [Fimbriimonadales bacterium]